MSRIRAFTLIELLIVIAIIATLGSATVLVLNPLELMRQGRDGTRINDTENIEKAVKMTLFNNPSLIDSLPSTNIYLSLPTGSCPSNPPSGYSYVCNSTSLNITKTDGTGWIPLSLQNIASLPTDPNTSNNNFYYAFVADPLTKTYVISSLLESEKQLKNAAAKSGGGDPSRFEKGNVTLWDKANGLQGYWNFDGTGAIANGQTIGLQDSSGNGNNGTATNTNGTGMSFVTGKVGSAVQFDGVDDKIRLTNQIALSKTNSSISWWMKRSSNRYECIFSRVDGGTNGQIEINTSGNIRYESTTNNISSGLFSSGSATYDGNWHYYNLIFGTGNIDAYIDGKLVSQITASADTVDFLLQYFGNQQSQGTYIYGDWFTGIIDEVSFYNKVLSEEEVAATYNAQK